jgi:prepilin peptidase CpaA
MHPTSVIALLVSAAACASDLKSRRIPNILTFGSAFVALGYHLVTGGPWGLLWSLGGWLVGIAIFLAPFALGGLGAGDVKLLGALGAWLGPTQIVWLALFTGVAGLVMALVVALMNGYLKQALTNVRLLLSHWQVVGVQPMQELTLERSTAPKLAYAVPILAGTLVTVWLR